VFDSAALRARLAGVRDRIARAAGRVGRDPASIRLIAVSKTFSADHIRAAADAGQIDFGENKLQEAQAKIAAIQDLPLRWHMIGHLQSNKARKTAMLFDVIQSVDDVRLMEVLDRAAHESDRRVGALIQVDMAGEATKHGAREEALRPLFEAASRARSLQVTGLMLLPPWADDPELARPYFTAFRALRDRLIAEGIGPGSVVELSMGMSHDFEAAIEEGATMVRVGTAIFGSRVRG
jgi:pyridoxal phosphate enzyme (YggS family)